MEDVTKAPGRQERRRERTDSPCVVHHARSMPCASPRPAVPNVECRRANTLRWNVFRAVAARTTLRKTPTFVACHRVHAKKTTNSFFQENNVDFQENNVDFPGAKTQDEARAQANAAEKHAGPHRPGQRTRGANCRTAAARPARIPGPPTLMGRSTDGELAPETGSDHCARGGRSTEKAAATGVWARNRARGGGFFIRPSRKIATGDRAGRTPGFFRSARYPGASAVRGGRSHRRGRAGAPGLFVPCCGCAEARRETPKKSRPAGHRRPGRSRENLSTKIPA